MKAKEYFNRDIEKVKEAVRLKDGNLLVDIGYGLYKDFFTELQEIKEKRNIKFYRGFVSAVEEFNTKWNSLAAMFEKELYVPVIQKDGFKKAMEKSIESEMR